MLSLEHLVVSENAKRKEKRKEGKVDRGMSEGHRSQPKKTCNH